MLFAKSEVMAALDLCWANSESNDGGGEVLGPLTVVGSEVGIRGGERAWRCPMTVGGRVGGGEAAMEGGETEASLSSAAPPPLPTPSNAQGWKPPVDRGGGWGRLLESPGGQKLMGDSGSNMWPSGPSSIMWPSSLHQS